MPQLFIRNKITKEIFNLKWKIKVLYSSVFYQNLNLLRTRWDILRFRLVHFVFQRMQKLLSRIKFSENSKIKINLYLSANSDGLYIILCISDVFCVSFKTLFLLVFFSYNVRAINRFKNSTKLLTCTPYSLQ